MIADGKFREEFWSSLDQLVRSGTLVIDRPKGTTHPGFSEAIYPLDYGYLEGTVSGDSAGIDVWLGSEQPRFLKGILLTLDLVKLDLEIKLVLGCDPGEILGVLKFMNTGSMNATYITNPITEVSNV